MSGVTTFSCQSGVHYKCPGERFTFTAGHVPCECDCHAVVA